MTTTLRRRPGYTVLPRKPVKPTIPVTGCDTCDLGCHCEGGIDGIGCEHAGCWGRAATNDCEIGAEAHHAWIEASRQYHHDQYAYDQSSHRR